MKHRFLLLPATLAGVMIVSTAGVSRAQADEPKQHIDVGRLPEQATLVDDVVVPVPSEIFGVLDKLGSPNWHDVIRNANLSAPGARSETALLLGDVIAEGFVAVEAQDPEQVKKIGRTVLDLSSAIGVRKAVVARSSAIIEYADKKDWANVRQELDRTLYDVKQAMIELHDEELAQLVSLGGWLRGTEALTQVVDRNYTKDSAGLLHQPALLDYFGRRLDHMSPRLKNDEVVARIQKRLPEIRPLIGESDTDISKQSVEQIHDIVHDLVVQIAPAP